MLIGNIGVGLFILIIVWILALGVFVLGIKFQNNIAWISLGVAASLTIILAVVPVEKSEQPEQITDFQDEDKAYFYHIALLLVLVISAVLGFIFFFILHCIEPIQPKAIKLINHEY